MEIEIVKFFNQLGGKKLDKVMEVVSRVKFLVIFWLAVLVAFYLLDKNFGKEIFWSAGIGLLLHLLIGEILIKKIGSKIFGKRKRPYEAYPEIIRPIGRKFSDSSFPSSHLAITVLFFMVLLSCYSFLWPVAICAVMIVGYARIHNGMHYLSDVLVGIILGILYGWSGTVIIDRIF